MSSATLRAEAQELEGLIQEEESSPDFRRETTDETVEVDSEGYRVGFEKSKSGKLFGYKVMTVNDKGELESQEQTSRTKTC